MKNIEKYIMLVLILIAIGAIGAAVYFGINTDKDNSKKEENKQEDVLVDESMENDEISEEIKEMINSSTSFIFPNPCSDKYVYSGDFTTNFFAEGLSLNQFSKDDLITAAFYEIKNIPVCSEEKAEIDLNTINIALETKFKDSNLKVDINDIKKYSGDTLNFEFDADKIYVSSNNCDGCGVGVTPFYKKTIEKYEIDKNNLYIFYRAAYFAEGYEHEDGSFSQAVLKPTDIKYIDNGDFIEINFKNKIEELENPQDITWSKYPLYKATYEIIDEKIYFRANEIIEK